MLEQWWIDFSPTFFVNILPLLIILGVAIVIHFISTPLAHFLLPFRRITQPRLKDEDTQMRRQTLVALVSGTISFFAFAIATLVGLAQFISVDSLLWMIGLFGAGIGFSAKPFIGDFMTGVMFIAEDTFDVGEKVEIVSIEGVVEQITLRNTRIRGIDGELHTIPNGEIRIVRNFSRGRFTPVKATIRVQSSQLNRVVPMLEEMGQEAMAELPNLIEPWRVITEEGRLGQHVNLDLIAKARFGHGAEMRPRLLALVQSRLEAENVTLVD